MKMDVDWAFTCLTNPTERQGAALTPKGLLIERLLAVERAYAEQEDRWLRVNDELLTWQLRAAPARSDRDIVRADSIEVGMPHHGYESPVTHRGD